MHSMGSSADSSDKENPDPIPNQNRPGIVMITMIATLNSHVCNGRMLGRAIYFLKQSWSRFQHESQECPTNSLTTLPSRSATALPS
jgi:hypothetical protein